MSEWDDKPANEMTRQELENHLSMVHEVEIDTHTPTLAELVEIHDEDNPVLFVAHAHSELHGMTDFELLDVIESAPGPTDEWERATAIAHDRAVQNALKFHEYAAVYQDPYNWPVCEDRYQYGECAHSSCKAIWDQIYPFDFCHEDGWQIITESGGGSGYAGGAVYWDTLLCGHTIMDESDDVRAAR